MEFENTFFVKFEFTKEQIKKNLNNALKDFDIAKKDKILEVKFGYTYTALIKAGVALFSFYRVKIRSVPGHHVKIIEKMAEILKDDRIAEIGNIMRSKRNLDFYGGGVEVTEKECKEFLKFAEAILSKVKSFVLPE